jgi:nucleoside-diphosphate-sugar epimerase
MACYSELPSKIQPPADNWFHLAWAGVSGPEHDSCHAQIRNIQGACDALLSAMASKTRRFIFTGSNLQHQYAMKNNVPVKASPVYGVAKTAAQNMCRSLANGGGMNFQTVFFSNVYGVGDRSKRSANSLIINLIKNQQPALITGEHLYDWIYIDDAVEGLAAVADRGAFGKDYYIGNRKLRAFKDIICEVRDILNPSMPLTFGGYPDPTYTDYSKFDLEALHQDTGFLAASDFRESIIRTAEWVESLNW